MAARLESSRGEAQSLSVTSPLVSVIIPAYNVERYIETAIRSVLNQDYGNIELIVVDDGSTDGTRSVIEGTCGNACNCRLIHTANNGVSAARNIALDACKGDYVLFLDSDDYLPKNAISILLSTMEEAKADVVLTRAAMVHPNGFAVEQHIPDIAQDSLSKYGPVSCGYPTFIWDYFFSRQSIGKNRFDANLPIQEDTVFVLSTCRSGLKYALCTVPTYCYRVGRVGSALSELSLEQGLYSKSVRLLVLKKCNSSAPGYRAAEDYAEACFGVLRRATELPEIFFREARLSEEEKRLISTAASIKGRIVLFAYHHPRACLCLLKAINRVYRVVARKSL